MSYQPGDVIEISDRTYIVDAHGSWRVLEYSPAHWSTRRNPVLQEVFEQVAA